MYKYYNVLKNPENEKQVGEILRKVFGTDILTEDTIKETLLQLKQLKEIDEAGVYEAVINDLKNDDLYKRAIN